MEQELKEKWVAALRSGNYEQGRWALRDVSYKSYTPGVRDVSYRYCCLGVLCDIVDPDGWLDEREHTLGTSSGTLKQGTARALGVVSTKSKSKHASQNQLARLNDTFGKTFTEIADYIEREF